MTPLKIKRAPKTGDEVTIFQLKEGEVTPRIYKATILDVPVYTTPCSGAALLELERASGQEDAQRIWYPMALLVEFEAMTIVVPLRDTQTVAQAIDALFALSC